MTARLLARTLFRYGYFRGVRLIDLVLNSRTRESAPKRIGTVLLVEVQDIGDTIIASPCIRQVRRCFPHAQIHVLVQSKSLDMVRHNPHVDEAVGVSGVTSYPRLLAAALGCRRKGYDLVLSLSPSVRNSLIAVLSGGRVISGYLNDAQFCATNHHDHPIEVRGWRRGVAVTYRKEEPLIVRALKAGAPFGVDVADSTDTEIFLPPGSDRFAEGFLARHGVDAGDLLVGMHPVCLNHFRNWPAERFAALGDLLAERYRRLRIFLIGVPEDAPTLQSILSRMRHGQRVICDTTLTLGQLAAVIGRCDVLVGMDSCPSDISGALNVPTVHLHGPTDPRVTGPGGRRNYPVTSGLPCSPCGLNVHHCPRDKQCMRDIDVATVLRVTAGALETHAPAERLRGGGSTLPAPAQATSPVRRRCGGNGGGS